VASRKATGCGVPQRNALRMTTARHLVPVHCPK
jgi:hypothetical protein